MADSGNNYLVVEIPVRNGAERQLSAGGVATGIKRPNHSQEGSVSDSEPDGHPDGILNTAAKLDEKIRELVRLLEDAIAKRDLSIPGVAAAAAKVASATAVLQARAQVFAPPRAFPSSLTQRVSPSGLTQPHSASI